MCNAMCEKSRIRQDHSTVRFGDQLNRDGYVRIPGSSYLLSDDVGDLKALQGSYFALPADDDGGQRFRAYKRYRYADGQLREVEHQGYTQSEAYNYTEGGKIRQFAEISPNVTQLRLIRKIIEADTQIMRESGAIDPDQAIEVALHQLRYQPENDTPSYSSPPWLHKDDEPIVFVHLVNASANLVGGDNIIATGRSEFQRVLRLSSPFDTLLLSQKVFHAVTPVGISSGVAGYRDILIVAYKAADRAG